MSENDDKTIVERLELCEEGLTAIETILRVTFPQFFEPQEDCDNGHEETISGSEEGPGETGEDAGGEEEGQEKGEEETDEEKGSEETP